MVKIVVRNLHWLLVQSGITCKILLLVFKALKDMRRTKIPHYRGLRPHHKGRNCMNFGVFGTKRTTVHNRNFLERASVKKGNRLYISLNYYVFKDHLVFKISLLVLSCTVRR